MNHMLEKTIDSPWHYDNQPEEQEPKCNCNDCDSEITDLNSGLKIDGVIVCNHCFVNSGHYETTDNRAERIEFLKWEDMG